MNAGPAFDAFCGRCARLCVLIIFLEIAGKRALAKLNASDLVVKLALGSTLASIIV